MRKIDVLRAEREIWWSLWRHRLNGDVYGEKDILQVEKEIHWLDIEIGQEVMRLAKQRGDK